ncbi:phosphate transport system regulatory protein PhoU [Oscillochloris trichoides DG-6]|uniref:Phosphate-specific transport system accessory protein PhoU n=1 Tax=Oscillochloris trichoides DG-6 TaxID=765420 RepID=E1ICR3_9CHLR|nr:phosphate signaling complex protein PhoU [Oscillochloris trichoides]EFO81011.1 phosphate transport system regulatory protein PhoU [Oscillochloris trichoides DG-6]
MVRERYTRQIGSLREDLLRMGSMVEQALLRAITSLDTWDSTIATQVIHDDAQIDEIWRSLEERTIHLLATQQPIVASDLRLITVANAIASELERIGDYANIIARRVRRATRRPALVTPPPAIKEMATLAIQMLNTSLEAFLRQDVDLAHSLAQSDERVDELEDQLRSAVIAMVKDDPEKVEAAIDMLDAIHALERTADRATNIGERVIFLSTNSVEDLN